VVALRELGGTAARSPARCLRRRTVSLAWFVPFRAGNASAVGGKNWSGSSNAGC